MYIICEIPNPQISFTSHLHPLYIDGYIIETNLLLFCHFRTCLEAEKIRVQNLTQALELERANSRKNQDALESERKRVKEFTDRQHGGMEDLRRQLTQARQQKADLQVEVERGKIDVSNLESELETERAMQGEALGMCFTSSLFK